MSKNIKLKGSYDTPAIEFNPKKSVFCISGRSLPANSFDFYSPIFENVMEYVKIPGNKIKFEFKMDFINSSSARIFQELFYELEQLCKKGAVVEVNWFYRFGDEDMKELGDDLRQDTNFPFAFIAYE